jgi:hypothetical protein
MLLSLPVASPVTVRDICIDQSRGDSFYCICLALRLFLLKLDCCQWQEQERKGRLEMNPDIRSRSNVTWDPEVAIEFRVDFPGLMNTSLLTGTVTCHSNFDKNSELHSEADQKFRIDTGSAIVEFSLITGWQCTRT